MQPMLRERPTRSDRFGPFVGVMREDEIIASAVEVESVAEEAEAHGHAFDVPARASRSPR